MTTGLILALVFAPGAVIFLLLLCALRLNASKPTPRPGETPVNRTEAPPVPQDESWESHPPMTRAVPSHAR